MQSLGPEKKSPRPRSISQTDLTSEASLKILNPPSIRINVTGAFISNEEEKRDINSSIRTAESSDILLPNHTSEVSHIAVDIGGSLAKVVFFSRDSNAMGGRLTFIKFETERIDDCIAYISSLLKKTKLNMTVMATGGGAFKYYDDFKSKLGVAIVREDEMECLIAGLDFFITEIPGEVFTHSEQDPMHFLELRQDIYPYLVSQSLIRTKEACQYRLWGVHHKSRRPSALYANRWLISGGRYFVGLAKSSHKCKDF